MKGYLVGLQSIICWVVLKMDHEMLVFYLKFLKKNNLENFVAALDLGGGSSQVTFLPKNFQQSINNVPLKHDYSHSFKLFGIQTKLYTHRYFY